MRSKCICSSVFWQTEQQAGDFYDPENKLPKNSAGLKVRFYWVGCPQHNGRTFKRQPTAAEWDAAVEESEVTG